MECPQFLSYYPLKQGLKRYIEGPGFILYGFLLYYPLKQGLKQDTPPYAKSLVMSFYSTIH